MYIKIHFNCLLACTREFACFSTIYFGRNLKILMQSGEFSRTLRIAEGFDKQLNYKQNKISTTRFTWYSQFLIQVYFPATFHLVSV